MEEIDLTKLTKARWTKLDHICSKCGKGHADIEIEFLCRGLPLSYMQDGSFTRAWHWECLPNELKAWQSTEERLMWEAAMRPTTI